MQINIENVGVTVIRTSHRGSECDFQSQSLWKNIASTSPNAIYGPLNEYFHTLSVTDQDQLYGLYVRAYVVIEDGGPLQEAKDKLTGIVTELFNVIDYANLTRWVLDYGGIAYNDDIHEEYTTDYTIFKRQTYLKDEYNELVILSFMFKLLTPIWGSFLRSYNSIDTGYKELEALDLMYGSKVYDLPAMMRLIDYCEALTERYAKGGLTTSICTGMGTSEIPRFFLSLAVVRRISVSEIRNPDKTIIKIVYKFLESKAKTLSNGIRDKRGGKMEADEKESVGECYRVSQSVPDAAIRVGAEYVMEISGMVRYINPTGSIRKARGYVKIIEENKNFAIAGFHTTISGLICDGAIHLSSIHLFEGRKPLIALISITAGWLSDNGYQLMANMLLANREEKNKDYADIYEISGFTFTPLSKENKIALEAMYPYRQQDSKGKLSPCQGLRFINDIVSEINTYVWDDHTTVPTNLRNELVALLLLREERKFKPRVFKQPTPLKK